MFCQFLMKYKIKWYTVESGKGTESKKLISFTVE